MHWPFCSSLHSTQLRSSGQAVGYHSVFITGMCHVPLGLYYPLSGEQPLESLEDSNQSENNHPPRILPGFDTRALQRHLHCLEERRNIVFKHVQSTRVPMSAPCANHGSPTDPLCPWSTSASPEICPGLQLLSTTEAGPRPWKVCGQLSAGLLPGLTRLLVQLGNRKRAHHG